MAQNTNLNVTPYYDDFDKDKNFYRVLFRPGFPIQARELTTMQSILQNQIENIGSGTYKDGSMVIPGQVGYDLTVDAIMLQESFLGADVEQYRSQLTGKIIEGLTSGVKAKVLFSISDTESDKGYITLYVKYIESGGDSQEQTTFSNNEQLVTDVEITFGTTLIEVGSPFAQLLPTGSLQQGSVAYIQPGVYYIRGFFVDVDYQYLLLDQYGSNPSYRVGLDIQESIITPEDDLSLNDNAAGTSNYAAPGSHRFRITTKLNKKLLTDDADKDFIELLRLNNSKVEQLVDRSALSELEKSLALRTYEESGDYVVKDFNIAVRENLDDGNNNGVYAAGDTTAQDNTASSDKYAVEFGPGTAYVRGYRVSTLSQTFVDLDKPRDTANRENTNIAFKLGNLINVNNVYGFPNTTGSTITNAYQTVELRDTFSASAGTAAGEKIGLARVISFEHRSNPDGTYGNTDDNYKANLMDIQMFTILDMNSNQTLGAGVQVVGRTSGARGYTTEAFSNAGHIDLIQVEGSFIKNEMLTVDGINLDTIDNIHTYQFSDVRQLVSRDETTSVIEFTSDLILEDIQLIQGSTFTYDATGGNEDITGLQSNFALDLRPGDRVYFSSTKYVDVDKVDPDALSTTGFASIFDYAAQTVNVTPGPGGAAPSAGTYTSLLRYRAKFFDVENANLLSKMPKNYVKSISDESMIVRRTFDTQTVSGGGSVSLTLPENEQFEAINDANFTMIALASTNGSYPVGSEIQLKPPSAGHASNVLGYADFTSSDNTTLQIDNLTNITSVKITATIAKNVTTRKTKSENKMFVLKVTNTVEDLDRPKYNLTHTNTYGTRIEDKDISLGAVDAYRLHAVYESNDDNDPVIPSVTLVEPVFFATGSIVTGKTSNARAKVVDFSSGNLKLTVVYESGQFQAGETLSGFDSNNTAINAIINDSEGSVVAGSKVITGNFFLEVNQTPFIYDISKITRKKGVAKPIRKLKVVFDYYTHSATGDYFGGQSYLNTTYDDIPFFGVNFLADYLDFRPSVKNLYSGTGSVSSPAYVGINSLDFNSRVFNTSGSPAATIFDVPKLQTNFKCDFDWYLPRTDKLFLNPDGEFQVVKGKSAEAPDEPDDIKDSLLLAVLSHKPYGFDPEQDVVITRSDHKRFTMKDIGGLERRLDQVEYYTSLNLLETDTYNTKILDGDGKDRLKNGFTVDDFSDHSKSDTGNEDFNAALDFAQGWCRASHYTSNVGLEINASLSNNYQQTGPLLTLPYTEKKIIDQPYASRVENINPFNVFTYIGRIDLTPQSDDWIDTERLPQQVTQIEGDFQAVSSEMNVDQNGFAPIQWGAWRDQWSSSRVVGSNVTRNSFWLEMDRGRSPAPGVWGGRGMRRINRTDTILTTTRQTRTGIRSRVIPRIDRQSLGDSVVSSTTIPFVRSRNIAFKAARMKPRTAFFTFFSGVNMGQYVMPKLIELIKDPAVDSRTNSTPFVIGETVTGLLSGVRLRVVAPNDVYKFNPYDDTELPSSYASTTAFLNVDLDSLAAQVAGQFFGNFLVGEVLVGASGAKAVVKDRRLLSDRSGKMHGSLFIPPARRLFPRQEITVNVIPGVGELGFPRFRTGTNTLRFTTDAKDSRLAGAVASSAEAEYEAKGTLNRVRENVLAVRNAEVVRDTVNQSRNFNTIRTETRQIGWYDPLAQSFIVDEQGGVFITSVDVYFNTKDTNIPVSMQIRTMENGYPTTKILPFSDVTLEPNDIQLSETAAVATKFTFRAPVYIPQSQEHCFVLLSDSNSYQVWVSRMGEVDITGDRTISEQPYAGVLFKSQNASTWTADQYEDLKFSINRAEFVTNQNSRVILNNVALAKGNKGVIQLRNDAIETFIPELQLTLDSTTVPFTIGARIKQKITLAEATIVNVQNLTAGVTLTINDITGTFASSNDLVSSKTTGTLTVASTTNFGVGDNITGGTSNATATITAVTNATTLALNFVSDDFANSENITGDGAGAGVNTAATTAASSNAFTPAGDQVESGLINPAEPSSTPTYTTGQRKVRIHHSNHGMHDVSNNVTIAGIESEISNTALTASISASDLTLSVVDATAFHTTINGLAISTTNPGYARIFNRSLGLEDQSEVVSYSAISSDGKTITLVERGLDGTTAISHPDETPVECYNLDGIPLTEINKAHTGISSPTLDTYDISTTSIARLGIRGGGARGEATQNIQYEILVPQVERMLLPGTDITARVKTISGTSINNGSTVLESSFSDDGIFKDITLSEDNYFDTPNLICSTVNESAELSGAKSFRMDLTLISDKENLSPVIDTERLSITCVSNRINNPSDENTALLASGDEHEAAYITRPANLVNPSKSLKVYFSGYRPTGSTIKVLYRVRPVGGSDNIESLGYNFFDIGDANIPETTENQVFSEYEYEVSGLNFDQYQIKVVFVSPNQAYSPIIKDFRAIALAV
tara:strand:- start:7184 stop:14476 length:7293 start_codon:yes stop_codon:yes gene_type:complete